MWIEKLQNKISSFFNPFIYGFVWVYVSVVYDNTIYTYCVVTSTPPLFQPSKTGESPRITMFIPSSNLNLSDNIAWKTTVRLCSSTLSVGCLKMWSKIYVVHEWDLFRAEIIFWYFLIQITRVFFNKINHEIIQYTNLSNTILITRSCS